MCAWCRHWEDAKRNDEAEFSIWQLLAPPTRFYPNQGMVQWEGRVLHGDLSNLVLQFGDSAVLKGDEVSQGFDLSE